MTRIIIAAVFAATLLAGVYGLGLVGADLARHSFG